MATPEKPPLIVIAGATASGKSALAMEVAARIRGVIVNADAMQVYADLPILTARPTVADEAAVCHRLYGVRHGAEPCSAAEWAAMAGHEVDAAHSTGRTPILVGGTGLYLRTLLEGIAPVPPIDAEVRAAVRALDPEAAWAALMREDPDAAARLNAADRQRTARSLEVARSTGRPLGDWQRARAGGIGARVAVRAGVLKVDRAILDARIVARLSRMVEDGVLDEVATFAAHDFPADLPIAKTVGLRPLTAHIAGRLELGEALAQAAIATRQYAKRQRTWLRNQFGAWPEIDNADALSKLLT